MPVLYKLYQDAREYTDKTAKTRNPNFAMWYARAIHLATKDTKALAKEVSYATTITEADCLNVINSLVNYMTQSLQNSYVVKLNDFGIFKIGLKTTYADTVQDFSVAKNIKGKRINFLPAYTVDSTTNVRSIPLLSGVKFRETPKNAVE